jgi:hypothetical protein
MGVKFSRRKMIDVHRGNRQRWGNNYDNNTVYPLLCCDAQSIHIYMYIIIIIIIMIYKYVQDWQQLYWPREDDVYKFYALRSSRQPSLPPPYPSNVSPQTNLLLAIRTGVCYHRAVRLWLWLWCQLRVADSSGDDWEVRRGWCTRTVCRVYRDGMKYFFFVLTSHVPLTNYNDSDKNTQILIYNITCSRYISLSSYCTRTSVISYYKYKWSVVINKYLWFSVESCRSCILFNL